MGSSTDKSPGNTISISTITQSSLHIELGNLGQRRKQLTKLKGKLSHQIGQRKKMGESFEQLLLEIKNISIEMKRMESRQSEIKSSIKILEANEWVKDNTAISFPLHITKPAIVSSDKNNIVSIKYIHGQEWQQLWNSFVDQHPHACVYHRYEFKHVIEESFGHNTLYLVALDSDNTIRGVLPAVHTRSWLFGNYITALPFFTYGGPLATSPQIEELLIQALTREADKRGAKHVEMRETQCRENYPVRTDKVSMILRLTDNPEQLWQKISSKQRAQILKGQGNKLEFKIDRLALLDDFYHVFSVKMRDLGTPVYAKSFFHNILQQDTLNCFLAVLYHHQQPISCAFLLGYNGTMEIPWASTLSSANTLYANKVLYWDVLKFAVKSKYQYFDFGRSSIDSGTYLFKKQWGTEPAPLYWHYWLAEVGDLPQINPSNPKYKLLIKIWQRLPVAIANLLGPYIVRSLP